MAIGERYGEILGAARDLFARRGFHQASIREIARAAGLSLAGLYHYVGGKDELLRDQAKAMECNLLLCPSCGAAFVPEAAWIYYEPDEEILAFVFPSYSLLFAVNDPPTVNSFAVMFAVVVGAPTKDSV